MLDKVKVQEIVERATIGQTSDGSWELNEAYMPELFSVLKGYIRKSANKSDKYDPDDACGELMLQLWLALKRYGPRPNGNNWADYTLPFKVKNVLRNRNTKRFCAKSKINYICKSLDQVINEEKRSVQVAGCPHFFVTEDMEDHYFSEDAKKFLYNDYRVNKGYDKNKYKVIRNFQDAVEKHVFDYKKDPIEKHILKCKKDPIERHILEALEDPIDRHQHKELVENFRRRESMVAKQLIKISDGKIGSRYATQYGKIIQLIAKTANKARVFVFATEREADVPIDYMVFPHDEEYTEIAQPEESAEPTAKTELIKETLGEEEISGKKEQGSKMRVTASDISEALEKEPTKKVRKERKMRTKKNAEVVETKESDGTPGPVVDPAISPSTATEPVKVEKKRERHAPSAKQVVVDKLTSGVCSRDDLAKAIIEKFPDRGTDVNKVKSYVSVIISMLKDKDKMNVKTVERGKYQIV